jgi:DNA-binding transcriptional LysR family regulator
MRRSLKKGCAPGDFRWASSWGPFSQDLFDARLIGTDEVVAVAAAGHPQLGIELSAQSLVKRAVILREPGSGTRAVVEKAFAQMGLAIEPLMSLNSTEAIKRMVMAKSFIAFLSAMSVNEELQRGDLALINVRELRIEQQLHLVWLKEHSLSPSAQAFFEWVLSNAAPKASNPASPSEQHAMSLG